MSREPDSMNPRRPLTGELFPFVQAAVYHADGMWGSTTFDLYLRSLPENAGFAVAAGVEEALQDILGLSISGEVVAWLRQRPEFSAVSSTFFTFLQKLRFSGEVWAVPEGSVVFPLEPILRVTAPLPEAVFLETLLLQKVAFATAVATCAARISEASRGRPVLDLSMRRWFSQETALAASRAAWVGGFEATSNLAASMGLGIEPVATLGGSFLAAYDDDAVAFDAFHVHFPKIMQLILPEEDPRASVGRFAHLGQDVRWVRIQNANPALAARLVREALDTHGMKKARILATGDLRDEDVARLVEVGAPIDAFGVSGVLGEGVTPLARSMTWRLSERVRGQTAQPARGPTSSYYPGRKQVLRGRTSDLICLERELPYLAPGDGLPLLEARIREGRLVGEVRDLEQARRRRAVQVSMLPAPVRRLRDPAEWPVQVSEALASMTLQ